MTTPSTSLNTKSPGWITVFPILMGTWCAWISQRPSDSPAARQAPPPRRTPPPPERKPSSRTPARPLRAFSFRRAFPIRRYAGGRLLLHLGLQLLHHIIGLVRVNVVAETPQRYADHLAVVEFGPEPFLAQFQPQVVQQVQVLRPQPRRVRSEVEIERLARGGIVEL